VVAYSDGKSEFIHSSAGQILAAEINTGEESPLNTDWISGNPVSGINGVGSLSKQTSPILGDDPQEMLFRARVQHIKERAIETCRKHNQIQQRLASGRPIGSKSPLSDNSAGAAGEGDSYYEEGDQMVNTVQTWDNGWDSWREGDWDNSYQEEHYGQGKGPVTGVPHGKTCNSVSEVREEEECTSFALALIENKRHVNVQSPPPRVRPGGSTGLAFHGSGYAELKIPQTAGGKKGFMMMMKGKAKGNSSLMAKGKQMVVANTPRGQTPGPGAKGTKGLAPPGMAGKGPGLGPSGSRRVSQASQAQAPEGSRRGSQIPPSQSAGSRRGSGYDNVPGAVAGSADGGGASYEDGGGASYGDDAPVYSRRSSQAEAAAGQEDDEGEVIEGGDAMNPALGAPGWTEGDLDSGDWGADFAGAMAAAGAQGAWEGWDEDDDHDPGDDHIHYDENGVPHHVHVDEYGFETLIPVEASEEYLAQQLGGWYDEHGEWVDLPPEQQAGKSFSNQNFQSVFNPKSLYVSSSVPF